MEVFWNQTSRAEWQALADNARAQMQQRWAYGAVHQALGGIVHRAMIWENGQPVALCQCICRRLAGMLNVSLASSGPLWLGACDRVAALALIRRTLPISRPRIQLMTLTQKVASRRLIALLTPATLALCDLPVAPGDLHAKWRNALNNSGNFDLEVRHNRCSPQALRDVLTDDAQQQRAKSYRALPAAFSLEWQRLAPEDLRLFTAYEAGQITARALFLRHGNTATYHIAHSSKRGRATAAARLLLWHAFQDFTKEGLTRVDLGAIDTENAPGLARFKLGTGATPLQMGPTVLAL